MYNTIHISVFKSNVHKRFQFAWTPQIDDVGISFIKKHNTDSKWMKRKHTDKIPMSNSKINFTSFLFLVESGLLIFSFFWHFSVFFLSFDVKKKSICVKSNEWFRSVFFSRRNHKKNRNKRNNIAVASILFQQKRQTEIEYCRKVIVENKNPHTSIKG